MLVRTLNGVLLQARELGGVGGDSGPMRSGSRVHLHKHDVPGWSGIRTYNYHRNEWIPDQLSHNFIIVSSDMVT